MNVVISKNHLDEIVNLGIDVIKSLSGEYRSKELIEMFRNFFFSHIIIDVTALTDFDKIDTYQTLADGFDQDKIILLLPEGSKLCTPNFLSNIINIGIYNFTTNINGIKYLLNKPNTYDDVVNIINSASKHVNNAKTAVNKRPKNSPRNTRNISEINNGFVNPAMVNNNMNYSNAPVQNPTRRIIGFRNVTKSSGATTLIYMIKKELSYTYGADSVLAIEVNKDDFTFFYDKGMLSIRQHEIEKSLQRFNSVRFILLDLNDCTDERYCDDVIYLIEPSTIKLNCLIRKNRDIFNGLANKKIVLNQSLLSGNDVFDFETESGLKIFYNIPPLDERKRNASIFEFISKLGLVSSGQSNNNESSVNKIFGLFRR